MIVYHLKDIDHINKNNIKSMQTKHGRRRHKPRGAGGYYETKKLKKLVVNTLSEAMPHFFIVKKKGV